MSLPKIKKAADATKQIQQQIGTALRALQGFEGRIVNSYGIYRDVYRQRQKLNTAFNALRNASKLFDSTAWPTESDYREHEKRS